MKAFLLAHSTNPIESRNGLSVRPEVKKVEIVTGPYDLIVELDATGMQAINRVIMQIQDTDPHLGTILPCWQLGE